MAASGGGGGGMWTFPIEVLSRACPPFKLATDYVYKTSAKDKSVLLEEGV